jgi:hypothetical protein
MSKVRLDKKIFMLWVSCDDKNTMSISRQIRPVIINKIWLELSVIYSAVNNLYRDND